MRHRRLAAAPAAALALAAFLPIAPRAAAAGATTGAATTPPLPQNGPTTISAQMRRQWAVAAESGVRIQIHQYGWYHIGQSDLQAAGLSPTVNPADLHLYLNGTEQPMEVDADGPQFSHPWNGIGFYGRATNTTYTDARAYYLVADSHPGLRLVHPAAPHTGVPAAPALTPFTATATHTEYSTYITWLLQGPQHAFFGRVVIHTPVDFAVSAPNLDTAATAPAHLTLVLQGSTTNAPFTAGISVNGKSVGNMNFSGRAEETGQFDVPVATLHAGANTVTVTPPNISGDDIFFVGLRLAYPHLGQADNNRLQFQLAPGASATIGGFSSSHIQVLDITHPSAPRFLPVAVHAAGTTYSGSFAVSGSGSTPHTLLAFTGGLPLAPDALSPKPPSTLNLTGNAADYLIIGPRAFLPATAPLSTLHTRGGMKVMTVDVASIFDEFNFGTRDPQAIRAFLYYTTTHWKKAPHYVLLAGSASYDPKNLLGYGNIDFVPTEEIDTSIMETASDEWLVDFKGDGLPQMDLGRLPARSVADLQTMVAKIIAYSPAQESSSALLVSSAQHPDDSFSFADEVNNLGGLLKSHFTVQTVNRASEDLPTAHQQIVNDINSGPLIVNYVGHGSTRVWSENMLTAADVTALHNGNHLPLFIMMTCLNGYFTDPTEESMAAFLLKAPHGGAAAVWGSTGETVPEPQAAINTAFYQALLSHPGTTLGDLAVQANAATGDPDVRRTWVMFGDPAMKIL